MTSSATGFSAEVRLTTLCIVNYNGAAYLPNALQAAMSSSHKFAEILLVDNASTDDSVAVVRREFPDVRVLALERNDGPGAARNAGFMAATCDLILFQDNDVRLRFDTAQLLDAVLREQPQALLVAPRVLYERRSEVIQYDSADCHFLGLMALRNANRAVAQVESNRSRTTSLVTACFLIDRQRWNRSALFDEEFIFNLEDHDFGVRVNMQGLQTWIEPRASVLHGEGTAGLSYRPGQDVASRRVFFLIRNRWFFISKNYALRTLLLLSPVLLLYELFQLAGLMRKGWLREWVRALSSFKQHWPVLRQKRRAVQSSRRASDRQILQSGPLPYTVALRSGRVETIAIACMEHIANAYWKIMRGFI